MKISILFIPFLFATVSLSSQAGGPFANAVEGLATESTAAPSADRSGIDLDDILEIFEESELFEKGTSFIWTTYGVIGNVGKRPQRTKGLIPPVSLNYEVSIFRNFGLRASGAIHTWNEDRTLARYEERDYTELFEYQYWTAGLGVSYHFNLSEKFDPYVGLSFNYRSGRAYCECVDESLTDDTRDLFAGVRWIPGERFYLQAELGSTNVSLLEIGAGIRL